MKEQFLIGFPFNRVFVKQVAEPVGNALQPAHGQPPDFTPSSGPTRSPRKAAPSLLARSADIFCRTSSGNNISLGDYSRTCPTRLQSILVARPAGARGGGRPHSPLHRLSHPAPSLPP